MDVSKESLIVKIQEILALPLQNKCEELTKVINECGYKELQILYPYVVESIFGINSQRGWGLRTTSRSLHVTDFQILYQFLHPQGSLFQLCYKLIGDSYLRYDYPLSLVPSGLRQIIEDGGVPPFYVGKIQINPYTKERVSITLNPFEFYMYHFAYHLINPWLQRTTEQYDSAYLFLMEVYLTHFLPCDTSEVLPHVGGYSLAVPITWNVSVRSTEVPTVFRQSLLNQSNTSASLHTSSSLAQQNPAVEVWRSEVVLHIFIDLWLSVGRSDSSQLNPVREREPSTDHICILRNMIKHLHYFSNRILGDMSAMDQLKRAVQTLIQGKVYIFLRRCMQNWPLDGSFRLLLELWLSYIQPWRYTDRREDRASKTVDLNLWLPFMVDNLLCYTVIFEQLLPRFSRIDLTSPKNAFMLFRLSKVFSQSQLAELLSEIEGSLNASLNSSKPFRGNIKWQGVLQQQIIELEGYSFTYMPLFSDEGTEKIKTFLSLVAQNCSTARILLQNAENQAHKDVGFLSSLRDFFISAPVDEDVSLEDRRRVSYYLEIALHNLSTIFKVPAPDVPDSPLNAMATCGSNQESSFQCPGFSRNMQLNKKLEYQGDPDLQPVRSTEIGFLVRFLYQVSSKLNEMYGPEMLELYERPTLLGRMARQVLCGPMTVRTFEKPPLGSKKRYPTLIEKTLPPRISFRCFASRERVFCLLFAFIAFWLKGLHPIVFLFCAIAALFFFVLLKAVLSPLLRTSVSSNPAVQNNVSDLGLDLSSSF